MNVEHRVRQLTLRRTDWRQGLECRAARDRDPVTQAVMARLTDPPAPLEELAAQLIARAELHRTRRRRLRRLAAATALPAGPGAAT